MKGKLTLLVGAAVGYVAGTAAGRQRYEQLKAQAKRAMENPKVQEAAAEVQHKVADAAVKAKDLAAEKLQNVPPQPDPAHDLTTPTGSPLE